jgi:hypothetical protein
MRRTERTTVKRLSERCVYVVGMALDVGAIPRPEPFDFRGRPLGELLNVEANVEKRFNGGPAVWDRLSQRRQGLLDVLGLLISRSCSNSPLDSCSTTRNPTGAGGGNARCFRPSALWNLAARRCWGGDYSQAG